MGTTREAAATGIGPTDQGATMPTTQERPTTTTGAHGRIRPRSTTALVLAADATVVELARRGSDDAWRELVRRFTPTITAIARRHRLKPTDVADVTQVTWLQLHRHLDRLREPERVAAWLASTARHECLRLINRAQRDVLVESAVDELKTPARDEPVDALLAGERRDAVRRAVRDLPARSRQLLGLLMWDCAPYDCVSETMRMPRGSIGPTRERCLRALSRTSEIRALT
jgi:RNA polymerase sigma factor (sigma-70 family)